MKAVMIGIAIVAIGLIALPQTLALFAGQHDWYDTTVDGNQVPCEKCHSDVQTQLEQPGAVNTLHRNQGCTGCHMTTAPTKEGLVQGPGGQFHAAVAPFCLDCHTGNPGLDAREIQNGTNEAHKPFVNSVANSSILKGINEACVGCHTHVGVNITWVKPTTLELRANSTNDGVWVIGNLAATGSSEVKTSG